jgi:hypothetical protein
MIEINKFGITFLGLGSIMLFIGGIIGHIFS